MDKLLRASDVMQIVGCKRDKALSIMRKCEHIDLSDKGMRADLRVRETALADWLDSKTVAPPDARKGAKKAPRRIPRGGGLIPYKKEA